MVCCLSSGKILVKQVKSLLLSLSLFSSCHIIAVTLSDQMETVFSLILIVQGYPLEVFSTEKLI